MTKNNILIKQPTWDLSPLYASDGDPQIAKDRKLVASVNQKFVTKWKNRTDYLSDPSILKTALDEYEQLLHEYGTDGKEGYYFWLRTMQDQTDPQLKAKFAQVLDFGNLNRNELQFFELKLAKIPAKTQQQFLKNPQLLQYKHFLEKIFRQSAYLLSDAEEKIINLKEDPAYMKWTQMVAGMTSKEERLVLTENGKKENQNLEQLLSLINSQNKKVRDGAAAALNDIFTKHLETAENEMNAIMANKKVDDTLRKMPRPDFSRHLSDDMETPIVDALLTAVTQRNNISARYYALKAKFLGLKKLAYHERNIELHAAGQKFTFEQSIELVNKVFANLDPQFSQIFQRLLENGQIDIYPQKGKRGGAFCSYWLLSQPTYVLLNHSGKLHDILTIAHEMGHAINNELMRPKQNALNFGTPMATAECASTFMEDFVLQEILITADAQTRLDLLMTKLNQDISTIFRQVACYQFELELHKTFREKGYLPHPEIGKIFQKHMASYMGSAVEQSQGSENWWIYWSHIRTFFYVYSYASGLLISKSLQNSVKQNPAFIIEVKKFLSSGLSASPKQIFLNLGINISDPAFWSRGLDEVESLLDETEQLAIKLKKI